jgi:hypothetical protein
MENISSESAKHPRALGRVGILAGIAFHGAARRNGTAIEFTPPGHGP